MPIQYVENLSEINSGTTLDCILFLQINYQTDDLQLVEDYHCLIMIILYTTCQDNVKKDQLVTWEKLSSLAAIGVSSSVASLVEITASQMIETEKLYQKVSCTPVGRHCNMVHPYTFVGPTTLHLSTEHVNHYSTRVLPAGYASTLMF